MVAGIGVWQADSDHNRLYVVMGPLRNFRNREIVARVKHQFINSARWIILDSNGFRYSPLTVRVCLQQPVRRAVAGGDAYRSVRAERSPAGGAYRSVRTTLAI